MRVATLFLGKKGENRPPRFACAFLGRFATVTEVVRWPQRHGQAAARTKQLRVQYNGTTRSHRCPPQCLIEIEKCQRKKEHGSVEEAVCTVKLERTIYYQMYAGDINSFYCPMAMAISI